MPKPRVTATDRLSNVIEVVELGQRSGLLTVERGSGSVLEEAEIYFVAGRAVYASLAGLRGREALTALSRWGPCRFAFDKDAPRPSPNLGPGATIQRGSETGGQIPAPTPSATRPAFGGRPPEGSGTWNLSTGTNSLDSGAGYAAPYTGMPMPGPYPSPYPAPSYGTGMLGANEAPPRQMTPPPPQPSFGTHPLSQAQAVLGRRPRRAPDVRDLMTVVTTHNLSRSHRTLLLLADGEHTVLDLARLSSKSVDEVVMLLNELEGRGLVYYYS